MHTFLYAFLLALFSLAPLEQKGAIVIDNTIELSEIEYDFKCISEEQLPVSHRFYLKNISSDDLYVHSVFAACNCSSVDWNRAIIHPGDSTCIVFSFADKNFKGKFH